MTEKQLAEFFVEQRVLQTSQAEDVFERSGVNGKTVAQAMIDAASSTSRAFYETIANGLGAEFVDLRERGDRIGSVAFHSQRTRFGCTVRCRLRSAIRPLRVALWIRSMLMSLRNLRFALGKDIQVVVSPPDQIGGADKQYYGADTTSMEEVLKPSSRSR